MTCRSCEPASMMVLTATFGYRLSPGSATAANRVPRPLSLPPLFGQRNFGHGRLLRQGVLSCLQVIQQLVILVLHPKYNSNSCKDLVGNHTEKLNTYQLKCIPGKPWWSNQVSSTFAFCNFLKRLTLLTSHQLIQSICIFNEIFDLSTP